MKIATEKRVILTLEDNEIKILTEMIKFLKAVDEAFNDCDELDINGDTYNIEIFSDTIDLLKNLYSDRQIEGYLLKEES